MFKTLSPLLVIGIGALIVLTGCQQHSAPVESARQKSLDAKLLEASARRQFLDEWLKCVAEHREVGNALSVLTAAHNRDLRASLELNGPEAAREVHSAYQQKGEASRLAQKHADLARRLEELDKQSRYRFGVPAARLAR